ncbi:hypothetical protein [Caulobacter sp. 17J65-9]|uniref:hypothetical protein n=1 Tax=Caulobacter sp. 17J65-9 TaxID=2709382 RepID=UPI0013C7DCE3|nr:hypothetical protein [Caulobacter sp. 17J65-9]NEX92411.1 hypothetical protein [Caulobacter sp. 17J65-9]
MLALALRGGNEDGFGSIVVAVLGAFAFVSLPVLALSFCGVFVLFAVALGGAMRMSPQAGRTRTGSVLLVSVGAGALFFALAWWMKDAPDGSALLWAGRVTGSRPLSAVLGSASDAAVPLVMLATVVAALAGGLAYAWFTRRGARSAQ